MISQLADTICLTTVTCIIWWHPTLACLDTQISTLSQIYTINRVDNVLFFALLIFNTCVGEFRLGFAPITQPPCPVAYFVIHKVLAVLCSTPGTCYNSLTKPPEGWAARGGSLHSPLCPNLRGLTRIIITICFCYYYWPPCSLVLSALSRSLSPLWLDLLE